ncbi:response regulator [uncultured Bradyrhizobium sp.]|uniref:response regulator transcription factor n=1 Tax=uncultured Bradyrhizobium sp. TaxID=199684 RepID=UPI0026397DC3|nr:response regulator [uncultured Bradyrhizobium sp.]
MPGEAVIHVVEDDLPMRESLLELLNDAGYAVRAYARAEELLARGDDLEPGCIVSDVRMPGIDGLTLLKRLRSAGAALPLMLITGHGDVTMAVAAMKMGAVDFLEKPFEADVLLAAIEAALRRRMSEIGAADVEIARRALQTLTSRETEVFEGLVTGKSNKEIAIALGISPRTVEFHRAHIMEKTSAKGLADLVRVWLSGNVSQSIK